MILLDYTITAGRLCLTFGSGWKMRFAPIAGVVGFTLRPRRRLMRQRERVKEGSGAGGRKRNSDGEKENPSCRESGHR